MWFRWRDDGCEFFQELIWMTSLSTSLLNCSMGWLSIVNEQTHIRVLDNAGRSVRDCIATNSLRVQSQIPRSWATLFWTFTTPCSLWDYAATLSDSHIEHSISLAHAILILFLGLSLYKSRVDFLYSLFIQRSAISICFIFACLRRCFSFCPILGGLIANWQASFTSVLRCLLPHLEILNFSSLPPELYSRISNPEYEASLLGWSKRLMSPISVTTPIAEIVSSPR